MSESVVFYIWIFIFKGLQIRQIFSKILDIPAV